MTKRHRNHILEDQSRNKLRTLFTDIGWTVQDIKQDYGEDLFVRIFEEGVATPFHFFVQVKATQNIKRHTRASGDIEVGIPQDTATTWAKFQSPLFLILWDAVSDDLYWCHVQSFFLSAVGKKRFKAGRASVQIPVCRLTSGNLATLTAIVRDVATWSTTAYESLQILKEQQQQHPSTVSIFGSAALTYFSDSEGEDIVVVDEIETSLHPDAAKALLARLREPNVKIALRLTDMSGNILHCSKHPAGFLLHDVLQNALDAGSIPTPSEKAEKTRVRGRK